MSLKKTTILEKEMEIEVSCEMEDLTIYSYEVVKTEFLQFLEKTSHICENQEILTRIGQNLRMKFTDWPTKEQAKELFTKNILNDKRRSIKWSDTDKKLFYWIVMRYHLYKGIQNCRQLTPYEWREISKLVIGRNAHQCRLKWEQKYKIPLSEAPWTEEEDYLLQLVHEEFKKQGKENKWSQLAREIYKRSNNKIFRQPKQCRERWINRLNPHISNDPWTKQQEIDLLKTILMKGKKWSELSILYGRVRTENSLKNKYNSLLKKEKMKYELETINPVLFEKVQQLRKDYANKYGNITSIEEIDNYEWQFIVLAIQSLYIDLCTQEGRLEEAQKIKNDDFFDLFHQEQTSATQQSVLYKKTLKIQKIDSKLQINNDKCGIVIFNQKNKKVYITPYNVFDFKSLILHPIAKRVKQEEHDSFAQSTDRISFNNSTSGTQSIQQLLFLASQAPYYIPLGQSMFNSYWQPPLLASQGEYNNQMYYKKGQQKMQETLCKHITQTNVQKQEIDELFDDLGVDIKRVDSDDEK